MKKLILLLITCMAFCIGARVYAAENIEIYIDGEKLDCEVNPVNIDERVLVPMRAIFEALGADVSWDGANRSVWASRGDEFISLPIDGNTMSTGVNNSDGASVWVDNIYLDVPARIIDDRTYVPVRAVSETLGTSVSWDGAENRLVIDSRRDVGGVVYYSSDSDYQKLYAVGKNGLDRRKISERGVYKLEMYDGYVYYLDRDTDYLFRANDETGEEAVIKAAVNKLEISDGYIYYQLLDGKESGVLYRYSIDTEETERLTDNSVRYPKKYRDYIYFNIDGDNRMYCVNESGTEVHTIDLGESGIVKLYPFNCVFYGDYILVEDGMWYGNIVRMNLDGSGVETITQSNSIIFKNQQHDDKVFYLMPDNGQDIYCVNIDGSDNHLVHEGDPTWVDIELLAQWGSTVYYKNPMRMEIYRVNADGSFDEYTCYADTVKVENGVLFSSGEELYAGNLDGVGMTMIYDRAVQDFEVRDNEVYLLDKQSARLYMTDLNGNKNVITADSVGEWACE